jgi:hypothetical protein
MSRKLILREKYKDLKEFVAQIPRRFEQEGRTIYQGRNLIKVFEAPHDMMVNVKRYHAPRGVNSLVYSLGIRKPKGQRAYQYPRILLQKGIDTPEPVAYIEDRKGGLITYSYLISLQSTLQHTLYEFGNASQEQWEPMVQPLAAFTAKMHNQQLMHRDFSPGNVLWDVVDGEYRFSVVDINRMYFGEVDMKKGCENFARLWGPKAFFCALIRSYTAIRGFNEEEALRIALSARTRFWTRYQQKHPVNFNLEL